MDALREVLHSVAFALFHLGGLGLFVIGVVDSSFLTMPLANDLLVIALSAANHSRFLYYAFMAAAGSTLGCLLVDLVSRKAGSAVDSKVPSKNLKFVESRIRQNAGWTLALAAVLPPPFPFTPFVAAAAAAGYPRKKLLVIAGNLRLVRFAGEGFLAILFGDRILSLAESPAVEYTVIALIVLALAGSAFSIYTWVRRARSAT